MKLLWAFCLSSLLLTWSPLATSQAPHVMANNSQLDDLKLWVRLQGNNINPENAKWAGFANTAAKQGQLEILEYLHNLGVDFSQFDSFGNSTLHSASSSNKVNVVHWLLTSGIDPNLQKTVNHPTALHKAARYGASESVTLLLEAGADPLINSRSGTAFELADNVLVLHTLMAHWQKHGDGMPPPGLSPAAWWSFIGQPGRVPEGLLTQDLHQAECNALHWAAASGHLPTLKRLLQLAPRATLSSPCFNKWTPLKIAIRFNQPEAVGELLNHWQSVDVQDVRLAVKYGSATLARVLYDSLEQEKDDLAFYPREGNAVLINYDPEDLAYLVNRRVISPDWLLNQIGSHGDKMLELAPLVVSQGVPITQVLRTGLRQDNPYLVQWALKQNPPLQQINKAEPSPFIVAAKTGNTDLAKQLWHPDAVLGDDNYYERLDYFAAAGWTEKVLSFTHQRADLLTYALMEAVRYHNVDLLVDLVTAGVRAPRRRCRSVFDVAIRQSSLPAVELLARTHAGNKECLSEAVLSVIDNGDVAMLDPLLKHGANPNGTGDGYHNAVVRAVRDRKLVILMALLQAGGDPSAVKAPEGTILELAQKNPDSSDYPEQTAAAPETELSPLLTALNTNDLETLLALIEQGANLTQTNDQGETPAHIAIRAGQFDAASLLLNSEVLLKKDKRGRTPFHLIGAYGTPELASRAIELSEGVYPEDDARKFPLDYAARLNEPVALLLARADARHSDNLAILAAIYGQERLMSYLSREFAALDSGHYEEKPEAAYFMVALAQQNRDWYDMLLEQSLDPNDTFAGEPLLSMAARYNNLPAFESLLQKGAVFRPSLFMRKYSATYQFALLSQKPELAETLLNSMDSGKRAEFLIASLEHLSQAMPEEQLVSWLKQQGRAALDKPLADVLNPLIRSGKNLSLINALVRSGADLGDKDYSGSSPVQEATVVLGEDIEWGHRIALLRLLQQDQQNRQTSPLLDRLRQLFTNADEPIPPVWSYLQEGFSVLPTVDREKLNEEDPVSRLTLLDAAVLQNDTKAIESLLKNGATVTPQTLHIAAHTGKVEALRALHPAIYDLNARDFRGNTPLMTAVKADREDMVEALLSMGARPNVYNQDYRFPLKLAVFNKSESVVKQLLNHGAHPDGFSEQMSSNALRDAVVSGDLEIVKMLVNAGASENPLLGAPPYSVLPAAYKFAPKDIVLYLEDTFERTTEQQQSELDLAWEHGSEWARGHLLQRGVAF
ncbi:ankyrin repeat domain-containing protein [Marinobacter sp. LQ44]|uniref:ankyrin repeat domain-containing protein n=1 Tax=unclassified Marinobacter TaxID=83889 RepID=UPI000718BAAF|nr:ankyrin repeat domain-containing protein [Marinobacter sp. LQ44]AMQ89363.1 hypothetical protein ASQ50_11990 [Marinobacter sp. LQ44]